MPNLQGTKLGGRGQGYDPAADDDDSALRMGITAASVVVALGLMCFGFWICRRRAGLADQGDANDVEADKWEKIRAEQIGKALAARSGVGPA